MNQREKLKKILIDFCNYQESRTFSLKQLNQFFGNYSTISIGGKTPQATVRRILQELRNEEFLSFLDNSGHYTLRGLDLLDKEKDELRNIVISDDEQPNKKEYLRETFIRDTKLINEAKEVFGRKCFIKSCENTFLTPSKKPYIEVHHIIPLCENGEDALWNLSILCAHHHKMAHFAEQNTVENLQKELLKISHSILG